MKRRWLVMSVCVVLALVLALPASTQTKSVLVNGDFEADTSGWAAGGGTLSHTTTTTHGGSAGAAQVTIDGFFGSSIQCIDLSPHLATWPESGGVKYITYNGYLQSDGSAEVNLAMHFNTGTACDGSWIGSYTSPTTTSSNWTLHSLTEAIPATAQSVRVAFESQFFGTATFYGDDLEVISSTATAVQSRGLAARGGLWGVGLVGVLAGGVVLVRRRKEL